MIDVNKYTLITYARRLATEIQILRDSDAQILSMQIFRTFEGDGPRRSAVKKGVVYKQGSAEIQKC